MNKEEITRNLKNYITKTNIKFCKVDGSHVFDLCMEVDKLRQDNKSLRGEIKVHSDKSNNRYKAIKVLEKQLSQLQQEKEDLIKWLEDEDENLWATATDGHKFIKNLSLIERRTTLREILSKLKESDKDVSKGNV